MKTFCITSSFKIFFKRFFCFLTFNFIINFSFYAQNTLDVSYNGKKNYSLIERTDLRRYDNGKYKGLVNREVRSFIVTNEVESKVSNGKTNLLCEGDFVIFQDTKRANLKVEDSINSSISSSFLINYDGSFEMLEDNGFPSYRSFPAYPDEKIKKGDSWTAKAQRAVDPLFKGIVTRMPVYVQYTYSGDSVFYGEEVYSITAQWATRYGNTSVSVIIDEDGDKDLLKATGSHKASILVSKNTGITVLIKDTVDETYFYSDGNQISFKGTVSMFTEYPPALSEEIIPEIEKKISNEKILMEKTKAGVKLTIPDIKFIADSYELENGEEGRIKIIYDILKKVPDSKILIEGHTASTGNAKGEQRLSEERARFIALKLAKMGLSADNLICKGSGGTKPVADNSTPEGKAMNRRVEITILE